MKERLKNGLATAAPPIVYTIAFLCLMLIWNVFNLPSPEKTYETIISLYKNHGILAVSIAAIIEGIVLINLYFPGSAVILIGVATSRGDPLRAAIIVSIVTVAFILSSQLNYLLGFFGLHGLINKLGGKKLLNKAQNRYDKYGLYILPPCFIHPNLGGFMSVAAGIARLQWIRFLSIAMLSISLWNIFWGFIAYYFAKAVENVATQPLLVLGGLSLWAIVAFSFGFIKRTNQIMRDS